MKKLIAMLLALAMVFALVACGSSTPAESGSSAPEASASASAPAESGSADAEAPAEEGGYTLNWDEYDQMISDIRTTSDLAARVDLMHAAEDKLMETWCVLPIYYYNDPYMIKDYMTGMYANVYGMKYFYKVEMTNGADEMNIFLASEPAHLDPALNSSVDGGCLAVNSFEGLMRYNADGQLEPAAAESYEVSEDGMTYTFTLRDGLKWSNGDTLDASDFLYSWTRAASVETAADYAYLYEVFADCQYDEEDNFIGLGEGSIEVSEDGKTITAHLNAVCPYFLDLCAFPAFFPVYQETVEASDPDGSNPGAWANDAGDSFVCNGAYILSGWNHDSSMTYVKNENYWDADSVSVPTMNFMLTSEDTAAYTAYQAGDLDFIDSLPNDELGTVIAEGNPELVIADNLGTYYVGFNYYSDLYTELGLDEAQACVFRHALCLLVDRDYIIENIGQTGQKPATTFIPEGCSDSNGGEFKDRDYYSVDDYDANVQEAKELLASIGLYDLDSESLTQDVSFTYLTNNSEGNVKIAEALQADWGQIGINVTIEEQEWNVFLDTRKNGDFDVAREGWLMDYNDPINMLEMWTTNSGNNNCQFGRG